MAKRSEIIEELESFDLNKCQDGLCFCDNFFNNKKFSNIEELLYFSNAPKYYYNFSEKRLRKLTIELKQMLSIEGSDEPLFRCKDLKDDTEIEISPVQFSHKIVSYEDDHKVVTYDEETKHYECFYINWSKEKIETFLKRSDRIVNANIKFIPSQVDYDLEQVIKDFENDNDEGLDDAFDIICSYLLRHHHLLSGIKFTNVDKGVRIDFVTSKIFPGDEMV